MACASSSPPSRCRISALLLRPKRMKIVPGSSSQRYLAAQIGEASSSVNSKKNREFYSVGSISSVFSLCSFRFVSRSNRSSFPKR